ncbi:MAG: hypothetical protein IAG10_32805 [Planctomycetaceae bacterium]|nr:hypothetical protein [Planctomycetaceae bacterium]
MLNPIVTEPGRIALALIVGEAMGVSPRTTHDHDRLGSDHFDFHVRIHDAAMEVMQFLTVDVRSFAIPKSR